MPVRTKVHDSRTNEGTPASIYEGGFKMDDGLKANKYIDYKQIERCAEITKLTKNPCKLSFSNLNYEVEVQRTKAQGGGSYRHHIIKNVSGYAMPG
jgi:ABC-type multidrug transport system ATPase subunit